MPSKHLLSGPPKGSSSLGQSAYSAATPPTPAFPRNPSHVGGHARLGRTPNCKTTAEQLGGGVDWGPPRCGRSLFV